MAAQYLLILENADTFQLENGDDFQLDLGDTINSLNIWKGAVEPTQDAPSGNQVALWKGAVEAAEPITYVLNSVSVESASETSSPAISQTIGVLATSVESSSEVSAPFLGTGLSTYKRRIVTLTGRAN